jgi:DNA-binding protein H-NS
MLENLLAQREQIELQIAEIRAEVQADALVKVRELIRLHNISQNMLYGREIATKPASRKVAPKYMNSDGRTWSGRGRPPLWFDKKKAKDFAL